MCTVQSTTGRHKHCCPFPCTLDPTALLIYIYTYLHLLIYAPVAVSHHWFYGYVTLASPSSADTVLTFVVILPINTVTHSALNLIFLAVSNAISRHLMHYSLAHRITFSHYIWNTPTILLKNEISKCYNHSLLMCDFLLWHPNKTVKIQQSLTNFVWILIRQTQTQVYCLHGTVDFHLNLNHTFID